MAYFRLTPVSSLNCATSIFGDFGLLRRHEAPQLLQRAAMKYQLVRNLDQNFVPQQQRDDLLRASFVHLEPGDHFVERGNFQSSRRQTPPRSSSLIRLPRPSSPRRDRAAAPDRRQRRFSFPETAVQAMPRRPPTTLSPARAMLPAQSRPPESSCGENPPPCSR